MQVSNQGVGGETSTQIAARAGSVPTTVTLTGNSLPALIAAGLAGKYLVLSVLNTSAEPSGSATYQDVIACNAALAATYGDRYLDVRTYLVQHGLADAGISATGQDLTDIANDVIPTSLRFDSTHLLAAGYTIVAQQVKAKLQALGWA